jgi:hypothetical protein
MTQKLPSVTYGRHLGVEDSRDSTTALIKRPPADPEVLFHSWNTLRNESSAWQG